MHSIQRMFNYSCSLMGTWTRHHLPALVVSTPALLTMAVGFYNSLYMWGFTGAFIVNHYWNDLEEIYNKCRARGRREQIIIVEPPEIVVTQNFSQNIINNSSSRVMLNQFRRVETDFKSANDFKEEINNNIGREFSFKRNS